MNLIARKNQLRHLQKNAPDLHRRAITGDITSGEAMVLFLDRIYGVPDEVMFASGIAYYAECPMCMQPLDEDVPCPNCDTGDGSIPPPSGLPDCDLSIAVKKYGYNSTSSPSHPILWWRFAGQKPCVPRDTISLVDLVNRDKLADYVLVGTEPKRNMVIRRYRKARHD